METFVEDESEIKTFSDKPKPKEFITSRPTLQEMLEEVLQARIHF